MMDDLDVRLPTRPSTKPPASSLHIILTKALGENAQREANGSINLDASFVELILDLSANNERMIQRLEATVDQLNAKVDPLIEQMAEMRTFMKTGTKPSTNAGKSFASVASAALTDSIHAPTTRPPPKQVVASLKPKRVIIHSNPANTTLKDVPSGALVQKANEALLGLDA
ncbi:hypothetical protein PGT21_006567 [Puccinia graminis f. sp. tritici]|uniref:Uncharacterized protein n=1 Tax=Puccinia graminis f. sp. tritici TaxID=56615 RepID=A0A5B0MAD3_PUCGR|nr:hypothetical protein PGT21_000334 [Puccinia graminis f. sp. tritici]KAA1073256.1 hypothetical protein PGT21_006567 [Puccinia graminis f. sp. tritici]